MRPWQHLVLAAQNTPQPGHQSGLERFGNSIGNRWQIPPAIRSAMLSFRRKDGRFPGAAQGPGLTKGLIARQKTGTRALLDGCGRKMGRGSRLTQERFSLRWVWICALASCSIAFSSTNRRPLRRKLLWIWSNQHGQSLLTEDCFTSDYVSGFGDVRTGLVKKGADAIVHPPYASPAGGGGR